MEKIKAKITFDLNGITYFPGEEVEVTDVKTLNRLNEKGFIEPLDLKELIAVAKKIKEANK